MLVALYCSVLCAMRLQGMKEDLELLLAEKDHLQEVGEELVGLIGEPDKPEVERGIEDMDKAFKALDDACDARQRTLDDALRLTAGFHDELNVSFHPPQLNIVATLPYETYRFNF